MINKTTLDKPTYFNETSPFREISNAILGMDLKSKTAFDYSQIQSLAICLSIIERHPEQHPILIPFFENIMKLKISEDRKSREEIVHIFSDISKIYSTKEPSKENEPTGIEKKIRG